MKNLIKLQDVNDKWLIIDKELIISASYESPLDSQEEWLRINLINSSYEFYVAYTEENIDAIMNVTLSCPSAWTAPLESNKFKSCLSSSDKYPFSEYAAGHICTDLCTK